MSPSRNNSILGIALVLSASLLVANQAYSQIFVSTFDGYSSGNFGVISDDPNAKPIDGVIGGTGRSQSGIGPNATVSILNDTPLGGGGGGYLSITRSASSPSQTPQVNFTPTSAATSFAALTPGLNLSLQRVINGGFDFFYRSSADLTGGSTFRSLNIGAATNGIGMIFAGGSNDLQLQLLTVSGGFDNFVNISNSDNLGRSNELFVARNNSAFQVQANTTYHFGATFTTAENGVVTASLFGVEGVGDIDTTVTTNRLGAASFQVDEDVVLAGFTPGVFQFGALANEQNGTTQDFDSFRVYDVAPSTFAGIPEPSSFLLLGLGATALAAMRRRH